MRNFSDVQSIRREVRRSGRFALQVMLGRQCNYNCSYCIQGGKNKTPFDVENEENVALFDAIDKRLSGYLQGASTNGVRVVLRGGETTLYPFDEYVARLKSVDVRSVSIITNLSKPSDYFREMGEKMHLEVTASLHEEFCPLDVFEEKVLEVARYVDVIRMQHVLTLSNSETNSQLAEFAKKHGIRLKTAAERRHVDGGTEWEQGVQRGLLEKDCVVTFCDGCQEKTPALNNLPVLWPDMSLKGFECSVAKETIYVKHDGNVVLNLGCVADGAKLGNVFDANATFEYSEKPVVCESDTCFCYAPVLLRRTR